MKIVRTGEDFVCHLGRGEQSLLWDLLGLYPCASPALRLNPSTGLQPDQDLLKEALSEQRAENTKRLHAFLGDHRRFQDSDKGFRFSLSAADLEWLLQILNDVRVGSWVLLGSPDEKLELKLLDEKTAPHFWAMEMAGHFEMQMLSALKD